MPVRNTLVQLLALYIDPKSHNSQRYRQTDRRTDGRTDGWHDDANSQSYRPVSAHHCVSKSSRWASVRHNQQPGHTTLQTVNLQHSCL